MNKLINKILQRMSKIPHFWVIGDRTLRTNYKLNSDSTVFDMGGYEGRWANDIYNKYQCNIHIFEPVPDFSDIIQKRFINNKKIFVHDFGLSKDNTNEKIYLSKDGSSIFKKNGDSIDIKLVKFSDFISQNKIESIDLMKINIEGGEYDLLDEVIQSGFIKNIKNIQIQFHDFIPNAEERMLKIQTLLNNTHKPTYQFKFTWENWTLK